MNVPFQPLGVQSYCFRNIPTLDGLIEAVCAAGLNRLEVWPGHLKHDGDDPAGGIARIRAAGIEVNAYGLARFGGDMEANRGIFEFARTAGARAVTAAVEPEDYPAVVPLCEEYGVRLALHNHGSKHHLGRLEVLAARVEASPECIGVCLDSGWMLEAGDDPVQAVRVLGDRILGVHLKDFYLDRKPLEDAVPGRGALDLPAFLAALAEAGFDGYLSIEYEGAEDDPLPKIRECVAAYEDALAALLDANDAR